jgi:hypothetical protein
VQRGLKPLETGHDLQRLFALASNLGVFRRDQYDDDLRGKVQYVARLWSNDLRFAPTAYIESRWRQFGFVRGKTGLKSAAERYFRNCSAIIKRCELIWRR